MTDEPSRPTNEEALEALQLLYRWTGSLESNRLFATKGPGFGDPTNWFRKLIVIPRSVDEQGIWHEAEICDCDNTPLVVVSHADFAVAIVKLMLFNAIVPGGATYVIRGTDSIIRRWAATQERLSTYAAETRIDELPGLAKSGRLSAPQKREIGDTLLKGIKF